MTVGEKELDEFVCAVNNKIEELNGMNAAQKDGLNCEFSSGFNHRMSGLYHSLRMIDELRGCVDMIHKVREEKCIILAYNDKVYEMEWWTSFPHIELICTLPFFKCNVKKVFKAMTDSYK